MTNGHLYAIIRKYILGEEKYEVKYEEYTKDIQT